MRSSEELLHSINWLELRAICLAVIYFSQHLWAVHVFVRMDNMTANAYINCQGDSFQTTYGGSVPSLPVGGGEPPLIESRTPSRDIQYNSQLAKLKKTKRLGMAAPSGGLQQPNQKVGNSGDGLICFLRKHTTPKLSNLSSDGGGQGNRRTTAPEAR